MARTYDLVIVGTGVAANTAAGRVRAAGWRVAIVDVLPFGGTCALRGCDPKRVLAGAAEASDLTRRLRGRGIESWAGMDWHALVAFKRTFTDPIPEQRAQSYAAQGIEAFSGRAHFTGHNTIEVEGVTLEGRHILIATGAEPARLGIPGEELLATSTEFLDLGSLPRRILFVGGGYIAAELAHVAARAGAQTTILHRGERLLEHFDPDLVDWLTQASRVVGIDVHLRTEVEGIEKTGSGFVVRANSDGRPSAFRADLVIHAAGRVPALEALTPGAAGVALKNGRVELNEFLQSVSNPAVYAAGDAAQTGPPLTPVARHDAEVVAANLLEGPRHKPDYAGVPSVAFTIPPIAAVGLGEAQTRERGLKFRVNCRQASEWYTARRVNEPTYGFKVLVEEPSGRILGAHLVGPEAEEVINLFALAIRHGLTAGQLRATMFAYPTGASDLGHML